MNAIGMLFSKKNNMDHLPEVSPEKQTGDETPLFHGMLSQNLADSASVQEISEQVNAADTAESLSEIQHLLKHLLNDIQHTGKDDKAASSVKNDEKSSRTDLEQIMSISPAPVQEISPAAEIVFPLLGTDEEAALLAENEKNSPGIVSGQAAVQDLQEQAMYAPFIQPQQQAETILAGIASTEDVKQAAPKLELLLRQWTELEKKLESNKQMTDPFSSIGDKQTKAKEQIIWRELVQTFKNRQQFAERKVYQTDAKVTSTDIARWISSKLQNGMPNEGQQIIDSPHLNSMPMTRIEQHVIYLNQQQGPASNLADRQIMEQFQQLIKSSRFHAGPGGINQLSITLRPEHLGEMLVRFVEKDGEMIVRILVTSEASKHMLQANMHQLKHMFTPHQVTIERQDTSGMQQELQEQQGDAHDKDEEQPHSGKRDQEDNDNHDDEELATSFHQLLMNEKV